MNLKKIIKSAGDPRCPVCFAQAPRGRAGRFRPHQIHGETCGGQGFTPRRLAAMERVLTPEAASWNTARRVRKVVTRRTFVIGYNVRQDWIAWHPSRPEWAVVVRENHKLCAAAHLPDIEAAKALANAWAGRADGS
ncbi:MULTISPECIES: hypothetical protein [Frankia]|nr:MULTISPECIES: hypothetical protein [Frankia]